MKNNSTKNDPYKYLIREKLDLLPEKVKREIKNKIIKAIGKTDRTLYRYSGITRSDNQDIPAQDLYRIAECLNCSTKDLINYDVNDDKETSTEKTS